MKLRLTQSSIARVGAGAELGKTFQISPIISHSYHIISVIITMLRGPQYTKEQRVFMVNSKTRGDSFKCSNWDFKQAFPLAGRDPCKSTIWRQKRKFDKEGIFEEEKK